MSTVLTLSAEGARGTSQEEDAFQLFLGGLVSWAVRTSGRAGPGPWTHPWSFCDLAASAGQYLSTWNQGFWVPPPCQPTPVHAYTRSLLPTLPLHPGGWPTACSAADPTGGMGPQVTGQLPRLAGWGTGSCTPGTGSRAYQRILQPWRDAGGAQWLIPRAHPSGSQSKTWASQWQEIQMDGRAAACFGTTVDPRTAHGLGAPTSQLSKIRVELQSALNISRSLVSAVPHVPVQPTSDHVVL